MKTTAARKTKGNSLFAKIFRIMKDIVTKNKYMIALLIPIIFFRFYKIGEFITFLGDQGRDAIIIKRIITLEHLPAVGATSSVGSVFLGPLYYYLVAPFMLLSGFDPVGLAYGVAFLSLVGLCLIYWVTQKETDQKTGLFVFVLSGFSWVILDFSRFSWNPNLLPFFGFFTTYFFFKMCTRSTVLYGLLFGLLFGFTALHLHYLALLFSPLYLILYLFIFARSPHKKSILLSGFAAVGGILFMGIPLILFDVKNNFLNFNNFLHIFSKGELTETSSYLIRLKETTEIFVQNALGIPVPFFVILIGFAGLLFIILREKRPIKLLLLLMYCVVCWYLIAFAKLNSLRHPHYYMYIYICFYFLLGYALSLMTKKKIGLVVSLLCIVGFLIINIKSYLFLYREGNQQIRLARIVAQSILDRNPQEPYQVVSLPFTETDDHYRYFLELANKRPMSADTLGNPKELYILCHAKKCDALNDAQWQVAAFQNKKVATIWNTNNITIYKIVHGK